MKKNNVRSGFIRGVGVLTAATLSVKLLGALYRVPLSRILGAEGMGMYQSVFPMYALLVTLTGGGLTSAVSKLVAESDGRETVRTAFTVALALSVPFALAAAVAVKRIATAAGSPDSYIVLAALLPAVPMSAVCAVLRGKFQGAGNMKISAVGQITEQAVKIAAGLTLAAVLMPVSVAAGAAGCAAGVTAGEIASTVYCFVANKRFNRLNGVTPGENVGTPSKSGADNISSENAENAVYAASAAAETSEELVPPAEFAASAAAVSARKSIFAFLGERAAAMRLLAVAVPITLGLAVLPLCQVADSFVTVNLLLHSGVAHGEATALYGFVTGSAAAVLNIPSVLTAGLCATLLPKISRLIKRGEPVAGTAVKVVFLSAVWGAVCCAGLIVFAPLAVKIVCGSNAGVPFGKAVSLLRCAAFAVPATSVIHTVSAVLQGGGKAYLPALNLLIAAAVKETLNFILMPRLGILGFVMAGNAFYLTACILDVAAVTVFLLRNRSVAMRGHNAE